jgi:cytochrome b
MSAHTVRVWDLPTRLFHWALLACVLGLFITGNVGGNAMPWHFRFGYAVLSLLLFRIVWGLIGGRWSRFASFIYAPSSVLAYLRGQAPIEHRVGHSPVGAGSVFALLLVLLAQVATGLVSDDEISNAGPLTRFVSNARVSLATGYHKDIGVWLITGLVLLHVLAVLFYLYKKKNNLITPMLLGDKQLAEPVAASRDDAASRALALLVMCACAAAVAALVRLGG